MSDIGSADAIITAAKAVLVNLETLSGQIQGEIEAIKLAAARERRPLSEADGNRMDALEADKDKVGDAIDELSIETLIKLNNSSDVAAIKEKLDSVNGGLSGTLTRLRKIARTAATAAQVADGLAQLAQTAAALAV